MKDNETQAIIERYQRIIDISRDLASTLDLDQLLQKIVSSAAELCDAEAASILLFDDARNILFFQATTNLDQPLMRGLVVPVDHSIAGWIVQNRQPVIIHDVQKDDRHFSQISQVTKIITKSLLGTPLISKDRVVGVLEAINKKHGNFTEADKEILMTLSAQAAVAIETTWLFQQSDLISDFVHELRTPLASLSTAVHLLTRDAVPQQQKNQMIQIIYNEIERLSKMANDFLDIARMESGRFQFAKQRFSLTELLIECIEQTRGQAQEKKLVYQTTLPEVQCPFEGDKDKLKQAILNVISNAIKYNRPNGKIKVTLNLIDAEYIISIEDTGPGIPEEYIHKIFNKFYRVPGLEQYAQGTGLGLSIVKRIVESHSGKVDVFSEVNQGSTFTIHLPRLTTD